MICSACEKDLRPSQNPWQKVSGWERKRHGGGTNALKLREAHQEWLCAECMVKRTLGGASEQGKLI